jgi:hypothetical protein
MTYKISFPRMSRSLIMEYKYYKFEEKVHEYTIDKNLSTYCALLVFTSECPCNLVQDFHCHGLLFWSFNSICFTPLVGKTLFGCGKSYRIKKMY